MNTDHRQSNIDPLAPHIDAARTVPVAAVAAAQARLQKRLAMHARSDALALAGATAVALLVFLIAPMLLLHRDVFAAVRAHFANLSTLTMVVEQRFGGQPLQTTQMCLRADGSLRTDVGNQLSVIIDVPQHRMLTVLHGPKEALFLALPTQPENTERAVSWLQEIRAFQDKAEHLPHTRTIAGTTVSGWKLTLPSTSVTLWATDDGLPLAMEQSGIRRAADRVPV